MGQTLLEVAQSGGVPLTSVCGGHGSCGECVVRVASGRVSGHTSEEDARFGSQERAAGLRLACAARVVDAEPLVVEVVARSRVGDQPSQTEAVGVEVVPAAVRVPGSAGRVASRLGLAVDLGTTGLAAYLVDLADGRVLAAMGAPNPQLSFGEDVMSRLTVAITDPTRTAVMRGVLADELDRLVDELCRAAEVTRGEVVEAVVVGNTAMHHLFFGLPVTSLAWAPYVPFEAGERTVSASSVGLHLAEGATVTSPPVVAGFVGSDHVAMLVAAGASRARGVTAYLDVGTNTEISLVVDGAHWTCSAASGPAFEGAHIDAGMRAARGAIDRVRWAAGRLEVSTIEHAPAVGICGSGLLDAVAVLHAQGAVTRPGALVAGHPLVDGSGRSASVTLAGAASAAGAPIRLTRRDIGEVQLAKGAVRAGLKLLTETAGIEEADIEGVVLAGAFGTYLDVASARAVGLIPPVAVASVRQVGNGAGAGACLLLRDRARRVEALALVERISYVELTGHPQFQDRFTQALAFSADPWSS